MYVPFSFQSTFMWSGEYCMFKAEKDVTQTNQAIETFKITGKWPKPQETVQLLVLSNNTIKTVPICELAKAIYKVSKPKKKDLNIETVAIFSIIFLGLFGLFALQSFA